MYNFRKVFIFDNPCKELSMPIPPFKLERYFAKYEFSAKYMLSPSDCEPMTQAELLSYASPESRALWDGLTLAYTESQGHPRLLAGIAGLYEGIIPEQVLEIVPEEGILIAMRTLLKPGDHVVTMRPAYQSLYQVAEAQGCNVSAWMPRQGWHFHPDDLEAKLTPQTKLLVVNFPHNPSGAHASAEEFARIVEIARAHDLVLFSDEMYRWSEYDPADRLPSACELYEKSVVLCGVSKSMGLPGLRVGWLVTRDGELMEGFKTYKDYTTICSSAPSEILALIALENMDAIVARNLAIVKANLAALDEFFATHADLFGWVRPRAGTVAFAELKGSIPVEELAERLVTECGVMLVPGSIFDYPGNFFRLGFGRQNFPEALAELEAFSREL
jgi:aspartate/methionine/tyrosine aminotransferase